MPSGAGFTPAIQKLFEEKTGCKNPAEYFDYDTAGVGFKGPRETPDWSVWYPDGLPEGTSISEYGTAHKPGTFEHFWQLDFPMKRVTSVGEMEQFPWPDFTPAYRHEHLEAEVARLHEQGWYVIGGVGHIWENAWQITSMEKLMMDFLECPDQAAYVLDRITEDQVFRARRYAEAGVDQILCGDDVAMQHKMMMHPNTWREWLKPRWAKVWKAAREAKPDLQIFYHSDGNVSDIIPDLIECGVNVVNPQVRANGLDNLARVCRGKVCVALDLDRQMFPFGTPADIDAHVRETVEALGLPEGGLWLTAECAPDVPLRNIEAICEALERYRGHFRE